MFIQSGSYMTCNSCQFLKNYANRSSVISSLESSSDFNISLIYCNFESNSALMNSLSFEHSNVYIKYSEFTLNMAVERSKNIFCAFSNVYVY